MTKRRFLLLLAIPFFAFSQKQIAKNKSLTTLQHATEDSSTVNQFNKIATLYSQTDSTKALSYSRKALQLSQKIGWRDGIAKSNLSLASIFSMHLNYPKALYFFDLSLKTSNQKIISQSYQSISEVYLKTSNFSKALEYAYRSLKIDETIGNQKGIAKSYANLGSINYGFQKYSKALDYYNKAAQMYEKFDNKKELAIVFRNKAGVYNSLRQSDKALTYYEKASILCRQTNDLALQARILSDIALVYFNLENYKKAIENSYLSLKSIPKGTQDKQTASFSFGVLGDSYIEIAKTSKQKKKVYLDSAFANLHKAAKLHEQLHSNRDLAYDYSSITKAHKLKGDFKSALSSYEIAMIYEDSVFNLDNKETIKNLEDKRAIEIRDREIKINKLQLEAKEKQKWFFIAGLALLGTIGGLLFLQNSNRRKMNKKLHNLNLNLEEKNVALDQANKIKARFFSILNHDLRSPVYNLIHFLHLKKENPELLDEATKTSIELKTISSAENLLVSMEDMLLWSKSQMENFKPEPKSISIYYLFEDTHKHFQSEEKVKITFENSSDILVYTDENYLKTIMRNLTGNAIKALDKIENPTIVWKAWQENSHTFLSITDNGPGAKHEEFKALYDDKEVVGIKTGLGLHLIRDLAKAIDCQIEVDSKIGEGTTITLCI